MSKIDLHIHSSFSDDGELSPAEIITQCKSLKMELISITDHNSVRGVKEVLSKHDSLHILSGVELDCICDGRNFHLLGYAFDPSHREFEEIQQDLLRQEKAAAEQKIHLFQKVSPIPIEAEKIFAAAKDGIVTGELIAEYVLNREDARQYEFLLPYLPGGIKSDMPNVRFYWDYFAPGKAAHVPIHYLSLSEATELIHCAGGFTILAHPGQNLEKSEHSLLNRLLSEKIDGIEVFSSYHSKEAVEYYLEIAKAHHLFVTCGSDFHGKHKPNIQYGGHGAFWSDQELLSEIAEFDFISITN